MTRSKRGLKKLLHKYNTNTCNEEDFNAFLDVVQRQEQEQELNSLLKEKWQSTKTVPVVYSNRYKWYTGIAASVALLLGTMLFLKSFSTMPDGVVKLAGNTSSPAIVTKLVLSDGSTVLLREGGKLIQSDRFEGTTREVTLEGEAYFDIAPNPKKPFIIHTGKVKTTVLGTAFSLKADPNDELITLTVTHGKVRVEDDKKLVAVLVADKKLTYNKLTNMAEEKAVDANKEIDWKKPDLLFKNNTFEYIANELEIAYGVRIVFESEELKPQEITASIDGSEPLQKALEMLCTSQHAYFVVNDGTYKIRQIK